MARSTADLDTGAVVRSTPGRELSGAEIRAGEHRPLGWKVLSGLAWLALRVYPLVLVIGVWWFLTWRRILKPFVLPSPERVWSRALVLIQSGDLQRETLITMQRVVGAFALALAVGIPLGILIGRIRGVRLAARPLVAFLFPTPKVAIYPAMLILLGFGTASKVALGFSEALFPILLATSAAASQVDARLLWSARALGTSPGAVFRKVVLPAALPGILTGARIGVGGAVVGTFLAEVIAGSTGLGHSMHVGWQLLRTQDMYVSIVVISLIGFVLDRLFLLARSRLLAWSPEEGR